MTGTPLLEIVDLVRYFPVRNAFGRRTSWLRAVDGVSLVARTGETLGLVGESGCGKSTLGKTVMGIYRPTGGEIRFLGREIGEQKNYSEKTAEAIDEEIRSLIDEGYAQAVAISGCRVFLPFSRPTLAPCLA